MKNEPMQIENLGPDDYLSGVLEEHINQITGEFQRNALGKVLTIVDAAIANKEQSKAVKDLIKQAIWSEESLPRLKDVMRTLGDYLHSLQSVNGEEGDKYKLWKELMVGELLPNLRKKFSETTLG